MIHIFVDIKYDAYFVDFLKRLSIYSFAFG